MQKPNWKGLAVAFAALTLLACLGVSIAFAGGATVEHGDGSPWSFTATNTDLGLSIRHTWNSRRGDQRRTLPNGEEHYKISTNDAQVLLYITAFGPVLGKLGEGTGHLTTTTSTDYLNYIAHGTLDNTFIPPPIGVGRTDYTFSIKIIDRNGETRVFEIKATPID